MAIRPISHHTGQLAADESQDDRTATPDHSLLARVHTLMTHTLHKLPFSCTSIDPSSPPPTMSPKTTERPLPILPNAVVGNILDRISKTELGGVLRVSRKWFDIGSSIRKKNIMRLRSHRELQKIFHFFFPPLPAGKISNSMAANTEKILAMTVRHLLESIPERLAVARRFKEYSVLTIVYDPDLLTSLLEISYDFSLVQAFWKLARSRLMHIGTVKGRAQALREWIAMKPKELIELTELDCNSCDLLCLPAEVCSLTQLTKLLLSNNHIAQLHGHIGNLSSLETLNLSYNKLSSLPQSTEKLTRLVYLHLSHNCFSVLPSIIGKLTNLIGLYLSNNFLSTLPAALGKLVNLTFLSIPYNRLTKLPSVVGQLQSLTTIHLHGNKIRKIPKEMQHLDKLRDLHIADNDITTPFATKKWLSTHLPQTRIVGL